MANSVTSLQNEAFSILKNKILTGEFKPGERLTEVKLAKKLSISRTPVRDALKKLEKEKLVIIRPGCGAQVAGLSEKCAADNYEVRAMIEKSALKTLISKKTEKSLKKLKDREDVFERALERDDIDEMVRADNRYHLCLIEMSENEKLREIFLDMSEYMFRFQREYFKDRQFRETIKNEHIKIIESIENNQDNAGAEIIEAHISLFKKAFFTACTEQKDRNNQESRIKHAKHQCDSKQGAGKA